MVGNTSEWDFDLLVLIDFQLGEGGDCEAHELILSNGVLVPDGKCDVCSLSWTLEVERLIPNRVQLIVLHLQNIRHL